MLTKLVEITEVAKHRPEEKFTSLAHLINAELLRICHDEMDGKKAVGIDKVTKEAYSENLEDNLADLIARMKRQACSRELPPVAPPGFAPRTTGNNEEEVKMLKD